MSELDLSEDAVASAVLGDDAGGNTDQPPMDVDDEGRLVSPQDAADYGGPDYNAFADADAQKASNKPTGLTTKNTPTRGGPVPSDKDEPPKASKADTPAKGDK